MALWVVALRTAQRLASPGAQNHWIARAALAGIAGLLVNGTNVDIMNFRFLWASLGILRGIAPDRDA